MHKYPLSIRYVFGFVEFVLIPTCKEKLEQEGMCCGYCGTELLLTESIVSEFVKLSYAVFSGWHNAVN